MSLRHAICEIYRLYKNRVCAFVEIYELKKNSIFMMCEIENQ